MSNANQAKKSGQPNFIIMAVCDAHTDVDCESVICIEGQGKKLLEAYGFNDTNDMESLMEKLANNNFECEFILVAPIVNKALNAAMSISKDWHITFNDVFKSDIVDSIITAPAIFQPDTYIEALEYLQHKSVNTPNELNIIEQMALVSMTLCGIGALFNKQTPELQALSRKNAYYHVKNACTADNPVNAVEIESLIAGILNLFEPCENNQLATSKEFDEAMEAYQIIQATHGDGSDESAEAFCKVMQLAPDWFEKMAMDKAKELGLVPKTPYGFLADGSPVYTREQVAESLGVSDSDLPQGTIVDDSEIHRIQ